MRRLAFVKCDNGFKGLLYLRTSKKYGGMTKSQDAELHQKLLKNGKYKSLQITYIDHMTDQVESMLYKKENIKGGL